MNYLLDTHVFIWWAVDPDKLPEKILRVLESPANEVFLSVVSLWEMQIKIQLGKLQIPIPLPTLVSQQLSVNQMTLLPLEPEHIYTLEQLPLHHRDPFDRLLIAQALLTQFVLISRDPQFSNYPITPLW